LHLVLANAEPLWPLAIYIALVVVTAGGMVALSYVLGQRHRDRATGQPYESGIAVADDSARRPVAVHYYRVAILFVIFDLEAAFIFAWAVCVRQAGWAGYAEIAVFIAVLLVGLLYVVRQGTLDWGPKTGATAEDAKNAEKDEN
jgi:NADH-quinone oxidoreductase subunit A